MTRRFEKPHANGLQFWEVVQQGQYVCLAWGEVGGARKQLDRHCPSNQAAAAKLAELVEKQLAAGYIEVVNRDPNVSLAEIEQVLAVEAVPIGDEHPPPKPARVFASSPELELQCRQAPDDPAPWEIYGDWLMAQGDIRGELAALRRAHKERDTLRLVASNYDALFGQFAEELRDIATDLEWRHGFVHRATLKLKDPDSSQPFHDYVRGFLASPVALFVDGLRLGLAGRDPNDWGSTLRAIAQSPQASFMRTLRFDAETHWEISWTALGDLDGWSAFPRLELLRLCAGAGGTLGTLELPSLKIFEYESCGISERELRSIAAAEWPALERLELWLGAIDRGAPSTLDALQPILDAKRVLVLSHLGLCNSELIDDAIVRLAESKLLPQLRTLDLSKGTLLRADGLLAHREAFRHLRSISLERNLLSDEQCDRLREALPNVKLDDQRWDDIADEPDPEDVRYVAVWE